MIGIYKITNKLNGKAYIGQSRDIEQRWAEHISQDKPSKIHQAIIQNGVNNFSFEVIEECEESELNEKEIYWIAYYNSFYDGYNSTKGGGGASKLNRTAIYEDYLKTNNMAQTAKNMGCHKTSVRQIAREHNISHSEMQEMKPIEQIDPKTLQVIHTYPSIAAAAEKMGVIRETIAMAVNGRTQSSCGYYWKAVNDDKIFEKTEVKKWKTPINQLSLDGNLIKTFESAADAAESLGKDRRNGSSYIIATCKGKKKTAYGFKWQYAT